MAAPNTQRKKRSVLESIFSESKPLLLHEYVKLITNGRIDLMVDSTNNVSATAAAEANSRKERDEQRDYIRTVYVVPEANPVIQDVLQHDPAPINDVVRKLIAHAVRNRCTTLTSSSYAHDRRNGGISVGGVSGNVDGAMMNPAKAVNPSFDQQRSSVLTLGYRQTRNTNQMAPICGDADVECSHVNSVHSFLLNSKWQAIVNRTGETVVRQILSRPVFIRTANDCYIQISGLPANEHVLLTNRKRRLGYQASSQEKRIRGLTVIPRESIMYSRRYCKRPGLLRLHILNRKSASIQDIAIEMLPFLKSWRPPAVNGSLESEVSGPSVLGYEATCMDTSSGSETFFSHMPVFSRMVHTMRESYRGTNVSYLLALYCSVDLQSKSEDNEEDSDQLKAKFVAKRTRGCRGGLRAKNRKIDIFSHTNTQSTSSILARVARNHDKQMQQRRSLTMTKPTEKSDSRSSRQANCTIDRSTLIVAPNRASAANYINQATETSGISEDSASQFYHSSRAFSALQEAESRARTRSRLRSRSRSRGKSLKRKRVFCPSKSRSVYCAPSEYHGEAGGSSDDDENTVIDTDKVKPRRREEIPKGSNLFSLSCPIDAVKDFIKSVCRRVFTIKNVWGSRRNASSFLAAIDTYVRLGRGETLTVMQLCHKISTKDIPWIKEISSLTYVNITAPSATEILHNFIYWIFSSFINNLLSVCFYITEGEGLGTQLLYYRKRIWNLMMKMGETQLEESFVLIPEPTGRIGPNNSGTEGAKMTIRKPTKPRNLDDDFLPRQSEMVHSSNKALKPLKPLVNINYDRDSMVFKTAPLVRLVPKKNSLRPITNMTQRSRSSSGMSTNHFGNVTVGNASSNKFSSTGAFSSPIFKNSDLYNTLNVLRRAHNSRPSLIGFGTFGLDDIYEKIRSFKCRPNIKDMLERKLNIGEREEEEECHSMEEKDCGFYFAAIDIERCYDNIDTRRLYDIVRNILRPSKEAKEKSSATNVIRGQNDHDTTVSDTSYEDMETSLVHRYSISHRIESMERVFTKQLRVVTAPGDMIPFTQAADAIGSCYHNAVINDHVIYPTVHLDDVLTVLKHHLFNHVVNFSSGGHSRYYAQVRGIPQGSILSPLLCNLYYGHIENEILLTESQRHALQLDKSSVIVRLMDDYLMISTDKNAVKSFLSSVHSSFRKYGANINPLKSRVNFDCHITLDDSSIEEIPRVDGFILPWCGSNIDTRTLEVTPDYKRILKNKLSSSVYIDCTNRALSLRRSIKSFFRIKCHALYVDNDINSKNTAIASIYSSFLVTALRTHMYLKREGGRFVFKNIMFIIQCIVEGAVYGSRLIRSRASNRRKRKLKLNQIQQDRLSKDRRRPKIKSKYHDQNVRIADQVVNGSRNGAKKSARTNCMKRSTCEVGQLYAFSLGLYAFLSVMKKYCGFYGYGVRQLEREYASSLLQVTDEDKKIASKYNESIQDIVFE